MSDEVGQIRDEKLDAEREARRRSALLQIRQFGDPVLRLEAKEVEAFDGDLERLVDRMKHLMVDANGVGLAATQIGILRRVFVMQPDPEEDPVALVNPRIVERGDETEVDDEGCLSLQGVIVPVERSAELTVEALDERGRDVRLELLGRPARVVQHELDHLDGVLIVDKTTDDARREAMATLRAQLSVEPVPR